MRTVRELQYFTFLAVRRSSLRIILLTIASFLSFIVIFSLLLLGNPQASLVALEAQGNSSTGQVTLRNKGTGPIFFNGTIKKGPELVLEYELNGRWQSLEPKAFSSDDISLPPGSSVTQSLKIPANAERWRV